MKKYLSLLIIGLFISNTLSIEKLISNNRTSVNSDLSISNSPFITKFNDLYNKKINKIITDPNGIIYAYGSNGLYKSTDGTNFTQIYNKGIACLTIGFDGTIYMGSDALYKSTDGTNFTQVWKPYGDYASVTNLVVSSNGTIYASIYQGGLYKSMDGTNFSQIPGTLGIEKLKISNDGTIWASGGGLYKSTDGTNFIKINSRSIDEFDISSDQTIYASINENFYKSIDNGVNFTQIPSVGIDKGYYISNITIAPTGTIYVGTNKEIGHGIGLVYISNDGNNFVSVPDISESVECIYWTDGSVYIVTGAYGIPGNVYKCSLIDNLVSFKKPNFYGLQYNGFVYNKNQTIDLKDLAANYLSNVILDGSTIDVSSKNIELNSGNGLGYTNGEHTLILSVKSEYQKYINFFGGDVNTGKITYNFWIKDKISSMDEISYKAVTSDTNLLTGLISNKGNTSGNAIIQTRAKDGSIHDAKLNISLNSNMFDFANSYYISGTVDTQTNNFTENGSKVYFSKQFSINNDGSYHLHLTDLVGNIYDSYLELGQDNWKLNGTFDDKSFNELASKLNVTVNLTDPTAQQEANGWLQNYERDIKTAFNKTVEQLGKGFTIKTADLVNGYKDFLDSVTYTDTNTKEAINQTNLNKTIISITNKKLVDGLNNLPNKDLNVNTKNVVDQNTLTSYTNWILGYQKYINDNKNQWFNNIVKNAARGFASQDQINKITEYLNKLPFNNYLKSITWTSGQNNLKESNDYLKFVELDKLQNDITDFVEKTYPDINKSYHDALSNAENSVNMHGYTLNQLLNGKQLPQTKAEIDNFANGKSFSKWLQDEANAKYSNWQIKMGLGIGVPIVVLLGIIGTISYWRYSTKYRPKETRTIVKRALKEAKESE